jgi:hypothetical protein
MCKDVSLYRFGHCGTLCVKMYRFDEVIRRIISLGVNIRRIIGTLCVKMYRFGHCGTLCVKMYRFDELIRRIISLGVNIR